MQWFHYLTGVPIKKNSDYLTGRGSGPAHRKETIKQAKATRVALVRLPAFGEHEAG